MHIGTGKFQPNDVGIQRIFKFIIKSEATQFLIGEIKKQLAENPREPAVLPTEIGTLRNASVAWVHKAYKYFVARPEVVRQVSRFLIESVTTYMEHDAQAWMKCITGNWNLSYDCLTSDTARCALDERLEDDPSFALSIAEVVQPDFEDDSAVDGMEFDDDLGAGPDVVAHLNSFPSDSARAPPMDALNAALNGEGDVEI